MDQHSLSTIKIKQQMTSFYYYNQNPSGVCFLVLMRAFVILNLTGITKF